MVNPWWSGPPPRRVSWSRAVRARATRASHRPPPHAESHTVHPPATAEPIRHRSDPPPQCSLPNLARDATQTPRPLQPIMPPRHQTGAATPEFHRCAAGGGGACRCATWHMRMFHVALASTTTCATWHTSPCISRSSFKYRYCRHLRSPPSNPLGLSSSAIAGTCDFRRGRSHTRHTRMRAGSDIHGRAAHRLPRDSRE